MSTSGSQVLQEAASWSDHFHYDFAKRNIPVIGVVLVLCACDISMVQMLPWKDTAFFEESKGFPCKSLMRFALGADMVQASVSALCSIVYIGTAMASDAKNPTTSSEAQVFFGLNITVSLLTVIMSFVLLYLRERLLMMTGTASTLEGNEQGAARIGREEGAAGKRKSVEVELGGVYNKESAADAQISFSNPMHSAEAFNHMRLTIQDKDAQLAAKDEEIAEYRRKESAYEEKMKELGGEYLITDPAMSNNRDSSGDESASGKRFSPQNTN